MTIDTYAVLGVTIILFLLNVVNSWFLALFGKRKESAAPVRLTWTDRVRRFAPIPLFLSGLVQVGIAFSVRSDDHVLVQSFAIAFGLVSIYSSIFFVIVNSIISTLYTMSRTDEMFLQSIEAHSRLTSTVAKCAGDLASIVESFKLSEEQRQSLRNARERLDEIGGSK